MHCSFFKKHNCKTGFTLIELIIVIALITILSAILIPQFMSMRRNGVERAATALGKNMATAHAAIIAEYGSLTDAKLRTDLGSGAGAGAEVTLAKYVLKGADDIQSLVQDGSAEVTYVNADINNTGFKFKYTSSGYSFDVTYKALSGKLAVVLAGSNEEPADGRF